MRRTDRYRYPVIITLLVLLQFTVRSHLGGDRVAPDFLLLALLIYTIRAEPGKSAAPGCPHERLPSPSTRPAPRHRADGGVDRPRHHRDGVLPHADPGTRQVSIAV